MADDAPIARRHDERPGRRDVDEPAAEYGEWTDDRLVDACRRNSALLREYGADWRTIETLCTVEEHLRARNVDPNGILDELDG